MESLHIEALAHKITDRWRLSKTGFVVTETQDIYSGIDKNPENNINPLGKPISSITLFVFGDTHYHIPDRSSFDRTAILPSTKLLNLVRRHGRAKVDNWHEEVRPYLYNSSLDAWPEAIRTVLTTDGIRPTEAALVVHSGDIADDSVNQAELSTAIHTTQRIVHAVKREFQTAWGEQTTTGFIQAFGDHDVDYRAWNEDERTQQIQWVYAALGMESQPACFLQEIRGKAEDKGRKGVLVIDTNLLEPMWIDEVKRSSTKMLEEIEKRTHAKIGSLDDVINKPAVLQSLIAACSFSGIEALFHDVLLYPLVLHHKQQQDTIINRAKELKDVVIIGHKPGEVIKIAKQFMGNVTVIAGHRHIPQNSEHQHSHFGLPLRRSHRSRTKLLIVGAPTKGGLGVEFASKALGYTITIDAENNAVIHEIIPQIEPFQEVLTPMS